MTHWDEVFASTAAEQEVRRSSWNHSLQVCISSLEKEAPRTYEEFYTQTDVIPRLLGEVLDEYADVIPASPGFGLSGGEESGEKAPFQLIQRHEAAYRFSLQTETKADPYGSDGGIIIEGYLFSLARNDADSKRRSAFSLGVPLHFPEFSDVTAGNLPFPLFVFRDETPASSQEPRVKFYSQDQLPAHEFLDQYVPFFLAMLRVLSSYLSNKRFAGEGE